MHDCGTGARLINFRICRPGTSPDYCGTPITPFRREELSAELRHSNSITVRHTGQRLHTDRHSTVACAVTFTAPMLQLGHGPKEPAVVHTLVFDPLLVPTYAVKAQRPIVRPQAARRSHGEVNNSTESYQSLSNLMHEVFFPVATNNHAS